MTQAQNPYSAYTARYGAHLGGLGVIRFVWEQFIAEMAPDHNGREAQLDRWQLNALNAFGEGERKITIAACHGPGKTAVAAWEIVYSLLFRHPLRAVATAPSRGQIEGALMSEIEKWVQKLEPGLRCLLVTKTTRVEHVASPKTIYFEARTARPEAPEALQGIHEDEGWVLLIVDEASGVHEKIFESGRGSMSGANCQTILLSNPTRTSGFFFNTHHGAESPGWYKIRISHEDSVRVTDEFVEEIATAYGRDSNVFRVRCLGLFPKSDLDALIPFELVAAARERDIVVPHGLRPVWGLDVARFGDDSTVLVKRNKLALSPDISVWQGLDTMEVVGRVREHWHATAPGERPSAIMVDSIGLGAGVVDRLQELNLPAIGINVGESAALSSKYRNLRTELWFEAREWLTRRSCALPTCPLDPDSPYRCPDRNVCVHDRLQAELTMIKYDHTPNGKLMVETKKDIKKRGFKSPDVADAFVLTFAHDASTMLYGSDTGATEFGWNQPLSRNRSFV